MMKIAPVSLVIPTFNRAELISETLNSAINQSIKFQEIIVVDDGSSDNTGQVLEKYKNVIKYIRTENQGVQAARNTGISASYSELVVLCDSDDLLESNYLETTAPWMIKNIDCDVLYTNFSTFNEREMHPDKLAQSPFDFLRGAQINDHIATQIPELYKRSIEYQPLFTCGMMIRKSFISRAGGYSTRFKGVGAEDWEFTLRAIDRGQIALCIQPLAHVRKHAGNDSGNKIKMAIGEATILEYALQNHTTAKNYETSIKKSIAKRRTDAFNEAFAQKDFSLAQEIAKKLPIRNFSVKHALKIMICNSPRSIRDAAWQFSQKDFNSKI